LKMSTIGETFKTGPCRLLKRKLIPLRVAGKLPRTGCRGRRKKKRKIEGCLSGQDKDKKLPTGKKEVVPKEKKKIDEIPVVIIDPSPKKLQKFVEPVNVQVEEKELKKVQKQQLAKSTTNQQLVNSAENQQSAKPAEIVEPLEEVEPVELKPILLKLKPKKLRKEKRKKQVELKLEKVIEQKNLNTPEPENVRSTDQSVHLNSVSKPHSNNPEEKLLKSIESNKEERKPQNLSNKRKKLQEPDPELVKRRKTLAFKNASMSEMKVTQNAEYLKGNFRGALQEYIYSLPQGNDLELSFSSKLHDDGVRFSTLCNPFTLWGATYTGKGLAMTKKESIHNAALNVMLTMDLLTPKEHKKYHPTQK